MSNKTRIQTVQLDTAIKQPVALCIVDQGRIYVSALTRSDVLIELPQTLETLKKPYSHLFSQPASQSKPTFSR